MPAPRRSRIHRLQLFSLDPAAHAAATLSDFGSRGNRGVPALPIIATVSRPQRAPPVGESGRYGVPQAHDHRIRSQKPLLPRKYSANALIN